MALSKADATASCGLERARAPGGHAANGSGRALNAITASPDRRTASWQPSDQIVPPSFRLRGRVSR
eukprot:3381569-Prymnesium_polylepis.2